MSHEESQSLSNDALQSGTLREVHGRFLNKTNERYMLPADASEHQRLDLQSQSLFLALGSKLWHPKAEDYVRVVLERREGNEAPLILDIGTGSGKWAVDFAHQFPHCQVIGLDLVPVTRDVREIPSNCKFEIGDANLPFDRFHGKVSVVHARSINVGIKDEIMFMNEVARMLVPGGVFLRGDGDTQLYSDSFTALPECNPGEPGFSWVQKVLFYARNVVIARGIKPSAAGRAAKLLSEIPQFTNVGSDSVYVPLGGWVKGDNLELQESGKLMAEDVMMMPKAMRPQLLSAGMPEETVDNIIQNAEAEVQGQSLHLYSVWHYTWAVKTGMS